MRPGSPDCRGWWSNGRTCRHSSREPVAPSGLAATPGSSPRRGRGKGIRLGSDGLGYAEVGEYELELGDLGDLHTHLPTELLPHRHGLVGRAVHGVATLVHR